MNELLENLYREYRQGLYLLALSIVGSTQQAEDAVQNAFTNIFQKSSRQLAALENGHCVAYLFKSVRNSAIDLKRAGDRQRRLGESLFLDRRCDHWDTPADALLTKERDEILMRAIDRLNENDREAIVLKLFGGLSFEQAGEVTCTPAKTIATRYRRALEKLENHLKGQL